MIQRIHNRIPVMPIADALNWLAGDDEVAHALALLKPYHHVRPSWPSRVVRVGNQPDFVDTVCPGRKRNGRNFDRMTRYDGVTIILEAAGQ